MRTQPKSKETKNKNILDIWALRRLMRLSQTEFWSKVGVSQSCGSRFENGNRIPTPIRLLIDVIYVHSIDASKVKHEDMAIIEYLQQHRADLYSRLLKIVRGTSRKRIRALP